MSVNPDQRYYVVTQEDFELAEDHEAISKINAQFLALIDLAKTSRFDTKRGEEFKAELITQLEASYHDACVASMARDAEEANGTKIDVSYGEARVVE